MTASQVVIQPVEVLAELDRIDSLGKVTGQTKFPTDLSKDGMLWGAVLRSRYIHARISRINTQAALELSGVRAVVTHLDIPGEKNHGSLVPDQPIFCWDRVRFRGDAIAAVAADTPEIAREALQLIQVDYEPLPVIRDFEMALAPNAVNIYEKGNISRRGKVTLGNVEEDLQSSDVVVENTYRTGPQLHMPLETQGGIAYVENNILNVHCGGQDPYHTLMQISRSLNLSPDGIRIFHTSTGGAFGSKGNAYLAIVVSALAIKAGRPVKMILSREENTSVSIWRTPMKITMTTGANKDGKLTANKIRIMTDAGSYTSDSPTILDVCMESAVGPYKWRSVDIEGTAVFTNNGLSGAYRGFGAPQANFALESQLDILAEKLNLDPLKFRKNNVVKIGETSIWGHTETGGAGVLDTLNKCEKSDIWIHRRPKPLGSKPWLKIGVGISVGMKGTGFGTYPDSTAAAASIMADGRVKVLASVPELGQGNSTAYTVLAASILRCSVSQLEVITGTTLGPNTGPAVASKGLYAGGSAVKKAIENLLEKTLNLASKVLRYPRNHLDHKDLRVYVKNDPSVSISFAELAAKEGGEISAEGVFDVPRAEHTVEGSLQIPHIIHSYATAVVEVEVNTLNGRVKVRRILFVPEAGKIVNRDSYVGQCVGGLVQALGYSLMEDVVVEDGILRTNNFTTYLLPMAGDVPHIEVLPIEGFEPTGPFGAKGVAELPLTPVASAVANAIHDATGIRVFHIPATAERLYNAVHSSKRAY